MFGRTWLYRLRVIDTEACPNISDTTLGWMPCMKSSCHARKSGRKVFTSTQRSARPACRVEPPQPVQAIIHAHERHEHGSNLHRCQPLPADSLRLDHLAAGLLGTSCGRRAQITLPRRLGLQYVIPLL